MNHEHMSYEDDAHLSKGDTAQRDQAAREMTAVISANISTLLSELADILGAGASMHHASSLWVNPLHRAERCLALAVSQAAKAAGLVEYT